MHAYFTGCGLLPFSICPRHPRFLLPPSHTHSRSPVHQLINPAHLHVLPAVSVYSLTKPGPSAARIQGRNATCCAMGRRRSPNLQIITARPRARIQALIIQALMTSQITKNQHNYQKKKKKSPWFSGSCWRHHAKTKKQAWTIRGVAFPPNKLRDWLARAVHSSSSPRLPQQRGKLERICCVWNDVCLSLWRGRPVWLR